MSTHDSYSNNRSIEFLTIDFLIMFAYFKHTHSASMRFKDKICANHVKSTQKIVSELHILSKHPYVHVLGFFPCFFIKFIPFLTNNA